LNEARIIRWDLRKKGCIKGRRQQATVLHVPDLRKSCPVCAGGGKLHAKVSTACRVKSSMLATSPPNTFHDQSSAAAVPAR
jgi:hypothetical protein